MGNQLVLRHAVKPVGVNQAFGGNSAYYSKFLDRFGNPEKGHMGIDFFAPHATPLYAPISGDAWYEEDSHGGAGIYIRTGLCDYEAGQACFNVILWHLCTKTDPHFSPKIPTDGSHVTVTVGQLIGYTDNSGAPFESSGDHLHFGLIPTDAANNALHPANGFNGCIDPMPFFSAIAAQDVASVEGVVKAAAQVAANVAAAPSVAPAQKVSMLQAILTALKYLVTHGIGK